MPRLKSAAKAVITRPSFVVFVVFVVVMLFTADQADAASGAAAKVSGFLPAPFGWIGMGISTLLATIAEAKRRRTQREKQTLYAGAVQIVGSVKSWLDTKPDDERHDITTHLAAKQDATAQALVSQAKADLAN